MAYVEQFGPHLPFLRRYARALTGSQRSGDAYVRASLAALADAPDSVDGGLEPRVALYRFFHTIWHSSGARLQEVGERGNEVHDDRLQALAPVPRQAFLLTALEGFRSDQAATILNVEPDAIDRLVLEAQRDIDTSLATRVLIIEDEPIIAADLAGLVEELGHTVTGNATTRDEAVRMAAEDPPGLVLCDIQLADKSSGIDAAHDILQRFDVPIIFITAFPERLLTGEKLEPAYLIPKPFRDVTVKAAIGQALFFHPSGAAPQAA